MGMRKIVDQNMKDITDIKENFKNKSCFIDRINETQSSIMDELLLMKKQREIAEVEMKQGEESIRNLNNLVQQLNPDSGSFSDFQSFVQKEKNNSDEQFQNIKQQIKECKVSKDEMLKGHHKLYETENKVIKLEQEVREYMRNNTKQKKANNFDELIEVWKTTGKKVETLEELVETLEKCCSKTSNKISTIDEALDTKTLKINSDITLLKEKVMKNSKDIAQINTETDNLRNSFVRNEEQNNDIAVKVAQLSLLSSNTQKEIEKLLNCDRKNSSHYNETTPEFNQIRTEIATIREEISNIKCINRNKFEETYNSIKGIEHDISVCTNNLSEYKTVMENLCMQIK